MATAEELRRLRVDMRIFTFFKLSFYVGSFNEFYAFVYILINLEN